MALIVSDDPQNNIHPVQKNNCANTRGSLVLLFQAVGQVTMQGTGRRSLQQASQLARLLSNSSASTAHPSNVSENGRSFSAKAVEALRQKLAAGTDTLKMVTSDSS